MLVETRPAGGNDGNQHHRDLIVSDWKPFNKNTLHGFFTIITPSGLRIRDCTLHERDGNPWVKFSTKPWSKSDGSASYTPLIDFVTDEIRKSFQQQALVALDELFADGATPDAR